MPKSPKPRPTPSALRTQRALLTPEAFRELAEEAITELYDNSDTYEITELRVWGRKLRDTLARLGEHRDELHSERVEADGEA